jgi:hypothetical protein
MFVGGIADEPLGQKSFYDEMISRSFWARFCQKVPLRKSRIGICFVLIEFIPTKDPYPDFFLIHFSVT